MNNKFLLLYAAFSGLLLSYVLNNDFSLAHKFLHLFFSGCFTLLLIVFESELDKKNEKEKMKKSEAHE
jgi:hypothetical protein